MTEKISYTNLILPIAVSLFVFINLTLRLSNSNLGFLDLGTEIFNSKKLFENNYEYLFRGHIKLVQIIFLPIFYIKNSFLIFVFFIFLKSIIIFFFIKFFVKSKLNLPFIIFCPILWITSMFDFHYDIIFFPLYILISEFSKKNKNFYFLTLAFGFIKEHFFIIPLLTSIYLVFKKDLKIGFFLFLLTTFLSLIFYYNLFINNYGFFDFQATQRYFGIDQFSKDFKGTVNYSSMFFENMIFFTPLILYFFFFNYKFSYHLFIFFCLFLIFFILSFFHKLNLFSHYYIPFLPPLFYLLINTQLDKKYFIIFLLFFYNFIFSISPLSLWFWSNKYKYYNYNSMFSSDETIEFQKYLKKRNLSNNNIIIQNNFFSHYFLSSKNINIFPTSTIEKNTLVIINLNKEKFLYDQKCKKNHNECDRYYNLEYLLISVYKGFELIYSKNNIYILSN